MEGTIQVQTLLAGNAVTNLWLISSSIDSGVAYLHSKHLIKRRQQIICSKQIGQMPLQVKEYNIRINCLSNSIPLL